MGDVGYRSMHQGISHRFFFSIALDFAENEPIWYLSSGYYNRAEPRVLLGYPGARPAFGTRRSKSTLGQTAFWGTL